MLLKLLSILSLVFLLNSCASFRKMGLKMASPLIFDASNGLLQEDNWQNFEKGVMGNLKLIEGLYSVNEEDEALLATLVKGYAGYAYAVNETKYLHDKLGETEKTFHKDQAIANYTKAFRYGLRYLHLNDIEFKGLQAGMRENDGITKILNGELDDDDIRDKEVVFFTAHAMAGMINLQRDKMMVVAQLPIAKGMFDWVCKKDPEFNHGLCHVFYASYEAGRPRMLGGNPAVGNKMFRELIKNQPTNYLARVSYLEYYVIPMIDEDLYREQKLVLDKALVENEKDLKWSPGRKKNPAFKDPGMRFYQAMALEKYKVIKKYAKDIF